LGRLVRRGVPERPFKLRLNDEKESIPEGTATKALRHIGRRSVPAVFE